MNSFPLPETFTSQQPRRGLTPPWYNPTKGRRYEVPAQDHHDRREVIIEDDTNSVFIPIIWS